MNISGHDAKIAKKVFLKWLYDEGFGIDELDETLVIDVKPLYFEYIDKNTEGYKPPRKEKADPNDYLEAGAIADQYDYAD